MIKRLIAIILAAFFIPSSGSAEEIKKIENFIYSIHAFDGRIYRSTFAREASPAIYLLAGSDSFLSTRRTFIYYFPSMEGFRVDTDLLNFPYKGTLEITGNGITKALQSEVYTYTNMPEERATEQTSGISSSGDDVINSKEGVLRVYKGEAAKSVWRRYEAMLEEYQAAEEKWQQGAREFQAWQKEMVQKIREARAQGKDVSGLVSEVQTQHYPFPPQRPNYTVEPLLEAFVINLPVGSYSMRLRDTDGYIVEGSEKELLVFREKRSAGVCYQYASMDKVTKPGLSSDSDAVIYIDGTNDLYMEGYYQNEFNEFYHNKLTQNDSMGSVFRTKNAIADKITDSWLELYQNGRRSDILLEELYYIQTDNSKNTGYSIVVWDGRPNQPMQYVNPNFSAFYLPLAKIGSSVTVQLRNILDKVNEGSAREIRVVRKTWWVDIIYLLSLIPIGLMIRVVVTRIRLFSKA
jgi:hypothetical protein